MTLIEIMIVVAMIGGIMALATVVVFPGDDAKLKDEATKMAGTIKYLYNEAAIKNKYYRIAFNLDENSYQVESSSEPFFVALVGTEEKKPVTATAEEGETPAEEGATGEGEAAPQPPAFAAEESIMLKPVKFPTGIKIKDILLLHEPAKVETGMAYSYFLPNGWAEPMVVNLSDEDEENFYSLEINPLTGKSKIRTQYLELNPEEFRKEDTELEGGL